MATYLEQYLGQIQAIRSRIEVLAAGDFELGELKQLVSTAGLQTEHFLRSAVVHGASPKDDFAGIINALKAHGIPKEQREHLHQFRDFYNNTKHNPQFVPAITDALRHIGHAITFASSLRQSGIARINLQVLRKFHRVLWIAGWDHFIGGDTEVHILFPTDDAFAPSMDTIHISIASWDKVKEDLTRVGTVTQDKDAFPHQVYEAFRSDDDFHEAFVFEGEYRELVSILAKYEFRVKDLIEPMYRENTTQSMMQAFALASLLRIA